MKKLIQQLLRFIKKFTKEKVTEKRDKKQQIIGAKVFGDINNIVIEKNVSIGGEVVLFATDRIHIGEHTMIAKEVMIHCSTHDYANHPMWLDRIDRPVKIGKHVWLGARSIILPGVVVGDFAVVGAGAVVTKNVPCGAIVVGNPAKILKFRDTSGFNSPVKDYPLGSRIIKKSFLEKDISG